MISGDLTLSRHPTLSRWQTARALLIGLAFALAIAAVFSFQSVQESPALVVGQVSPKTILSPERITYASQVETQDARAKAEATVADVYKPPDAELARAQVVVATRFFDHVDSLRHDPYMTADRKVEWVRSIPTVTVSSITVSRTVALDESSYHRMVTEALYALDVTMRDEIRPSQLQAEYAKIPSRVSLALNAEQADLVVEWTTLFVIPNSAFDPQRTSELKAQVRDRVGTVYRSIEKGEAVVREGEVITPQSIEALEALGILRPRPITEDYTGPALLAILLSVLSAAFLFRFRPSLFSHWRVLLLLACLVLATAVGARITVIDRAILIYLYPIPATVMLLAVLIDSYVALGAAVLLSLTIGYFAHFSLEMTMYALVGGTIAALILGRIERLPTFLWAGVYVALGNIAVIAIFRVILHDADPSSWGQQLLAAAGNGALSGLIAVGSLFVLGKMFGITTSLELIDLARPTHPLLQQLLKDAPGTYHHSLVVGQLAEYAAQKVGADALLIRVGAYYHDVGKTSEPEMFIENQLEGVNIHDTLEPQASASIVIDHVAQGLTLAKRHRLPRRLVDFIPQHHGTTLAAYFHRKALRSNGNGQLDESSYRYPGPKPQTLEAGILMLADGVEATTRAEHPSAPEGIRAIIDGIVNERLRDGQLDECEITLRDIQQTKNAFFEVLQGLYHARVRYPEPPTSSHPDTAEPPEKIHEH